MSAVEKMKNEAEMDGYRHLIKAMNKLTAEKHEKVKVPPKPKEKAEPQKAKKETKEKAPKVPDEVKDAVRAFFRKPKPKGDEETPAERKLFVGRGKNRVTTKQKNKPRPVKSKTSKKKG